MTFFVCHCNERTHFFFSCVFLTFVVDGNAKFGRGWESLLFKFANEMEAITVYLGAREGGHGQVAKTRANGFQELRRNVSEKNKERVHSWSFRCRRCLFVECA